MNLNFLMICLFGLFCHACGLEGNRFVLKGMCPPGAFKKLYDMTKLVQEKNRNNEENIFKINNETIKEEFMKKVFQIEEKFQDVNIKKIKLKRNYTSSEMSNLLINVQEIVKEAKKLEAHIHHRSRTNPEDFNAPLTVITENLCPDILCMIRDLDDTNFYGLSLLHFIREKMSALPDSSKKEKFQERLDEATNLFNYMRKFQIFQKGKSDGDKYTYHISVFRDALNDIFYLINDILQLNYDVLKEIMDYNMIAHDEKSAKDIFKNFLERLHAFALDKYKIEEQIQSMQDTQNKTDLVTRLKDIQCCHDQIQTLMDDCGTESDFTVTCSANVISESIKAVNKALDDIEKLKKDVK